MSTTIENVRQKRLVEMKVPQPRWQRIILLVVLGYEAAGCLLGGSLLIAAPDGRLMDMPVEMIHGVFFNNMHCLHNRHLKLLASTDNRITK